MSKKMTTCLWFDHGNAREAAESPAGRARGNLLLAYGVGRDAAKRRPNSRLPCLISALTRQAGGACSLMVARAAPGRENTDSHPASGRGRGGLT